MDIRKLRYFVAVAEERHLGRAAERLFMSQPPLTRHIQSLEVELGVALFVRTPRGMELTQAGDSLLMDARSIFSLMGNATERAQRAGAGQAGQIDVGLYGSATFGIVPQVLRRFRIGHPDVGLGLFYAQTPAQVPALRQGRVKIVFERLLPNEPDIEVELVARERLFVAVGEGHRLSCRNAVAVTDLHGEVLFLGSSPIAAATVVDLCRRYDFEPQVASGSSDLVMATMQAITSGGVALVPASMTHVHFPGVCYRPLEPDPRAVMDVHCYWLRNERSPLLAEMLATIRAFRKSMGPAEGCVPVDDEALRIQPRPAKERKTHPA